MYFDIAQMQIRVFPSLNLNMITETCRTVSPHAIATLKRNEDRLYKSKVFYPTRTTSRRTYFLRNLSQCLVESESRHSNNSIQISDSFQYLNTETSQELGLLVCDNHDGVMILVSSVGLLVFTIKS